MLILSKAISCQSRKRFRVDNFLLYIGYLISMAKYYVILNFGVKLLLKLEQI